MRPFHVDPITTLPHMSTVHVPLGFSPHVFTESKLHSGIPNLYESSKLGRKSVALVPIEIKIMESVDDFEFH